MKNALALAALALLLVTGPVTAAASKWVVMAHWVEQDGEKVARPYAPGGQLVTFADEKSCKVALDGEQLTGAVNALKIALLLHDGEDTMESLEVACEAVE